jgi:L-lactate dehydrogenase complex protein LldG
LTSQKQFLDNVRSKLEGGTRMPLAIPPDWAPTIEDPLKRFATELEAVHGHAHRCLKARLSSTVADIVTSYSASRVLLTREEPLPPDLEQELEGAGAEVVWWPEGGRDPAELADVGVTGALWAVAETGTVVVTSAAPGGRAPSLLPTVHIAVVAASRMVDTVAALFKEIAGLPKRPSNLVLVTGPSKTGDIENILVQGVHGPKEQHSIVVEDL